MRFERSTGRKTTTLGGWWLAVLYGGLSVFSLLLGSGHAHAQSNIAINVETTSNDTSVTAPDASDTAAEPPSRDEPQGDAQTAPTQAQTPPKPYLDVYGFAQLDLGYDFKTNDPNWFDVNRPTKLPSFAGEFGRDGKTYAGVRQTRFGVKGSEPTALGELKAVFEFDMFGVGVDAGQTTIRPRHYYGELGPVLAGQTNSVFMDIDVFPNILEYWGPNGMVFFRNPQLRWMPIRGDTHLWIALERPGASADAGVLADRIEIQNVLGRFQFPDLTAQYRQAWKGGYVQGAAIVRSIKLDHTATGTINLDQSNKKDVLRLQYVFGDGVENYMNDAPEDVAAEPNFGNPLKPVKGKALPMRSFVTYLDHSWTEAWTTSVGYSQMLINNTILQTPAAFHKGQYATVNLLWSPLKNFMTGGEFQWARRTNFSDGFRSDDYRIQFSFKYSFNARIGG
jgi:DcaP outer membrane protein